MYLICFVIYLKKSSNLIKKLKQALFLHHLQKYIFECEKNACFSSKFV
jgi:hypothetical protein